MALIVSVAAHAGGEQTLLSLKPADLEPDVAVYLGDIVKLEPASSSCARILASLSLPDRTQPGQTRWVDRHDVETSIREETPADQCEIRWRGERQVTLRRHGVAVDLSKARRDVREALVTLWSQRYRDVVVQPIDQPEVLIESSDMARLEYSIPENLMPRARTMIIARLIEKDGHSRNYPIWFSVSAFGEGLAPVIDLMPGQRVDTVRVESVRVDVAKEKGGLVLSADDLRGMEAKTFVSAGMVLHRDQLASRADIEVGDEVALRYHVRDVAIEARGVALQSARVGQRVLVRAPIGNAVIAARALGQDLAEVLP